MSRYVCRIVTSPSDDRIRRQRTPPPVTPTQQNVTVNYVYGRELSETIGRIPCIGIDRGAMSGDQPGDGLH